MTTGQKELPAGWKWVKLGDVVSAISNGCSVKQNWDANGYLVSRIETISTGEINLDRTAWVELDPTQAGKYALEDGDILFSHINSLERVGNCALYTQDIGNLIHGMNLLRIQLDYSKVNSNFIKNYLCSDQAKMFYISHAKRAVNQASINIGNLKLLSIPLPPLEEQKRIAGILNKADELKKLREEADKKTQELIPAIFHEMVGSRVKKGKELPAGWKWVKLDDVCLLVVDSEHKTAPIATQGYPYVRTPDIGKGFLNLRDTRRVSRDTYVNWTKKAIPHAGDLILTREAPVGNVAVIPVNTELCLGQRTVLLRPDQKLAVAQYLCYLLLGGSVQETFHSLSSGATVPHLNLADIRKLEIPLPSLPEQKRIATRLNQAEEIKKTNAESNKKIEELQSSLLQRAFRGEL